MGHRADPSWVLPRPALPALAKCLREKQTLLKADSVLVFVCGARPSEDHLGARDRFLDYAKTQLSQFAFFRAEDVVSEIADLLSLEDRLARFSDCIILILEGESTFAELGAFSLSEGLSRKLLVINDAQYRNSGSFIARGPIAKADKDSDFGPAIYTSLTAITRCIPEVERQLGKIERKRGFTVDLSSYSAFSRAKPKHRLLFLHDLVLLFSPIRHRELIEVLKYLFGDNDFEIRVEISLLEAIGLLRRVDRHLTCAARPQDLFFDYRGFNAVRHRCSTVTHFHKYWPAKVEVFCKAAGVRTNA